MDPTALLGVSMQAMPGVYALLLGSGVSRVASVPTGYEVTLDLIRRIALSSGEACEPDPETWYEDKFHEAAGYSQLLTRVARRPAERAGILKGYFEPTAQQRAEGIKVPTRAHRAIARLVASGYVRVILTTNFDRLLEEALDEQAVRPVIISTAEAARGASPAQHNTCTVIKLHGDYLDPSIKNTPEELSQYSDEMNLLLDRVLDEWGLVVCGWSAQWDVALRMAVERCQNHRYSTYWASRGEPGDVEQKLIALRQAQPIAIQDADSFFEDLERSVRDLSERTAAGIVTGPGNLTPQATSQEVERLLTDPTARPRFRRFVQQQGQALHTAISDENFPVTVTSASATVPAVAERMEQYERLSSNVVAIMVVSAQFAHSKDETEPLASTLRLLAEKPLAGGLTVYISLRLYPALLALYAAGISAIAGDNYSLLWRLWSQPVEELGTNETKEAVVKLLPYAVVEAGVARQLPSLDNPRYYSPLSEHLYKLLRDPLRDVISAETEYDRTFDRYEALAALVTADLTRGNWPRLHVGRYGWKARNPGQFQILSAIEREIAAEGVDWPLLKVGAFDGEVDRAKEALQVVTDSVSQLPWW